MVRGVCECIFVWKQSFSSPQHQTSSNTVSTLEFFCFSWEKYGQHFVRVCVCLCQGLFRIAAGASKLKKLKAALDCSTSQLEEFYSDPHAVAGTSPFWVSSRMTRPFLSLISVFFNAAISKMELLQNRESACRWICGFRSTQVLPEGTAWASDDSPALRWMDPGLQARPQTLLQGIKSGLQ